MILNESLSNYPLEKNLDSDEPGKKDLPVYVQAEAERIAKTIPKEEIKAKMAQKSGSRDALNDQVIFNILQNGSTWTTITAQCYAVGTNCYIYIDLNSASSNGGIDSGSRTTTANNIVTAFDSDNSPFNTAGIYAVDRAVFGSEWKPGIDGDNRMTILISPALGRSGLMGYFYSLDETTASRSNQREIIYLNDNLWAGNMFNGLTTLAHEFQHLIDYNVKYNNGGNFETSTINEGKSMLAEHLNGFTPAGNPTTYYGNGFMVAGIRNLLANPQNFRFHIFNNSSYEYAGAYLFMLYLYERFGQTVFSNIASSPFVGTSNIAYYAGTSFAALFRDWALVNYYDGIGGSPTLPSGSASTRYNAVNLKGTYTYYPTSSNSSTTTETLGGVSFVSNISSYPLSGTISLNPWSCRYLLFTPPASGNLNLNISTYTTYYLNYNLVTESPAGTFSVIQ
ncbi:MAG: hypothetical protein HYU63_06475 [Armatimonadetes bacterium]|nr:hypothetical protein [Armatimonadota bacterium]